MGDGTTQARGSVDMQIDRLEEQRGPPQAPPTPGRRSSPRRSNRGRRCGCRRRSVATPEATTGIALIDHGIDKWRTNPSLMAYKLQSNSYKFSLVADPAVGPLRLAALPLAPPFRNLRPLGLRDLFARLYDAFLRRTCVLLSGLGIKRRGFADHRRRSLPPIYHIYRQLKGAYGLTRFSALWRTTVLCAFIFVILFLFVDVLLVLGALG